MDRKNTRLINLVLLIAMIICSLIYKTSDNLFFLVLALVIMAAHVAFTVAFDKCPHCGHSLSRHHLWIDFCPYCGGPL